MGDLDEWAGPSEAPGCARPRLEATHTIEGEKHGQAQGWCYRVRPDDEHHRRRGTGPQPRRYQAAAQSRRGLCGRRGCGNGGCLRHRRRQAQLLPRALGGAAGLHRFSRNDRQGEARHPEHRDPPGAARRADDLRRGARREGHVRGEAPSVAVWKRRTPSRTHSSETACFWSSAPCAATGPSIARRES